MVGFLGAIAGGAMKGWGAGQMEAIKAKREEKLKLLDMEFQRSENALTRGVQERQIASQEKLTLSGQALQERLGNLQAETTKGVAELGATVDRERIASAENIAKKQISAAQDLAEFQAASTQLLNSRLVQVTDANGKVINKVMTPEGKEVPKLKGPDGKEYDWVGPDADTDAAKNYQFLIANNFDPGRASSLAFGATSRDRASIQAGLLQSMYANSLVSPNAEKAAIFEKLAEQGADSIIRSTEGAAPGAAPGATPAPAAGEVPAAPAPVPTSAATPVQQDAAITQAKAGVANGTLTREAAKRRLIELKVPGEKIKAAGF